MNAYLQSILQLIENNSNLPDMEKEGVKKIIKDAEKATQFREFQLSRAENDKRVMSVMLEESIQDVEKKSRALEATNQALQLSQRELEAKNQELEIETALEKVRSAALAMNRPSDMPSVCHIISDQLTYLNVKDIRNVQTAIFYEEKGVYINFEYYTRHNKELITEVDYRTHPVQNSFAQEMLKGTGAVYMRGFEGEEVQKWYEYQKATPQFSDHYLEHASSLDYYWFSLGPVALGISTYSPLSEQEIEWFKRFRNVFELAYRRYLDIEKAEAQAREARIEAALERVRSSVMAMQKSEDLGDAILVVFEELDKLEMGALRCGISIINKNNKTTQIWSTLKSDQATTIKVAGDESMEIHPLLQGAYDAWLRLEEFSYVLEGDDLLRFYASLAKTNFRLPDPVTNSRERTLREYLYVSHFPAGGLYAFQSHPFTDEGRMIIRRFAEVFNLAYTRFNDLKQAEQMARQAQIDLVHLKEEKQKTDEALKELRATQHQLVQAEKMASLGELTAGIAHEIQNPLNFVNNFSDVSKELLDEMKAALERDDKDEANEIANDVQQNLEKILHHGKRADAIVKGMLQHSRTGTGQKELIHINTLADEYLRLSYHGLRARDKSFNARFETDFDTTITMLEIVPQDIGRVLLNLINNAFYATTEKKKRDIPGYEPVVEILTKQLPGQVSISVRDNGDGIPPKIMDKIFQPFFTTKPTGQGTGLGLSLSYDIVRAHGGELRADTREGEGATFTILLPAR